MAPSVEMSPEDEATLTRMRRDVVGYGSTFSALSPKKHLFLFLRMILKSFTAYMLPI